MSRHNLWVIACFCEEAWGHSPWGLQHCQRPQRLQLPEQQSAVGIQGRRRARVLVRQDRLNRRGVPQQLLGAQLMDHQAAWRQRITCRHPKQPDAATTFH